MTTRTTKTTATKITTATKAIAYYRDARFHSLAFFFHQCGASIIFAIFLFVSLIGFVRPQTPHFVKKSRWIRQTQCKYTIEERYARTHNAAWLGLVRDQFFGGDKTVILIVIAKLLLSLIYYIRLFHSLSQYFFFFLTARKRLPRTRERNRLISISFTAAMLQLQKNKITSTSTILKRTWCNWMHCCVIAIVKNTKTKMLYGGLGCRIVKKDRQPSSYRQIDEYLGTPKRPMSVYQKKNTDYLVSCCNNHYKYNESIKCQTFYRRKSFENRDVIAIWKCQPIFWSCFFFASLLRLIKSNFECITNRMLMSKWNGRPNKMKHFKRYQR